MKYYHFVLMTTIFLLIFCIGCTQSQSSSSGYTLVQITSSNSDFDPSFSPDDTYIVYDQKLSNGNHELFKININDLSQKTSLGTSAAEAAWNPADSNKIAFIKYDNSTGSWGGEAVYTMDANGGAIARIGPTGSSTPAWSTDGQSLLYEAYGSIYKVGVNGTGTTELASYLTEGRCGWPCFSYDGTQILFIKKASSTAQGGDIWIMNSDGSNKAEFLAASEGEYMLFQQAWNKYGEIVFMQSYDSASQKSPVIKLIKSDKTGLTTLNSDDLVYGDPVWDNSGKKIALIKGPADDSGYQNIYYLIYRN